MFPVEDVQRNCSISEWRSNWDTSAAPALETGNHDLVSVHGNKIAALVGEGAPDSVCSPTALCPLCQTVTVSVKDLSPRARAEEMEAEN